MSSSFTLSPDVLESLVKVFYDNKAQEERDILSTLIPLESEKLDRDCLEDLVVMGIAYGRNIKRLEAQSDQILGMWEFVPRLLQTEIVAMFASTAKFIAALKQHRLLLQGFEFAFDTMLPFVRSSYEELCQAYKAEYEALIALYNRIMRDAEWRLQFEIYSRENR